MVMQRHKGKLLYVFFDLLSYNKLIIIYLLTQGKKHGIIVLTKRLIQKVVY